jgi:hypothetical protein
MSYPIRIRGSAEAGIPTLAAREPGWTTDTHKLFVGTGTENVLVNHPNPLQFEDIFSDYVVNGLLPATSTTLSSDVSAGQAYVMGKRIDNAVTSNTYTASVDTYVDVDYNGAYTFSEVVLGAAAPAIAANSIRLAKVVTDATAITAVTDMRQLDLPATFGKSVKIDSNGNVGIGTTAPVTPLEVNGIIRATRVGVPSQYLQLEGGDASSVYLTAVGSGKILTIKTQMTAGIRFYTPGAGTALIIQDGGNVGIGTTSPTSRLHSVGSVANSIATKTVGYTATASDYTLLGDATAAAFTITLPAVAACPGRIYNIKKIDSSVNAVTIDGNVSETIDGALTKVLSAQWESVTIQNNGTSWFII